MPWLILPLLSHPIPTGTVTLGVNASISYLKATYGGVLTADAAEVAKSSKLATYQINIINEKNDFIAIFQGTVYRKKNPVIKSNK